MLRGHLSYAKAKYEFTEKAHLMISIFFKNMQLTIKYKTLGFQEQIYKDTLHQ